MLILFAVFVVLLMEVARVSFMAGDGYGRVMASGILAMLMFQMFVNVGMNIGLMPVAGIPLPMFSYGARLSPRSAFGILESILLRHRKLLFGHA